MIHNWGSIAVSPEIIAAADTIKHLNYQITKPGKFHTNILTEELAGDMMAEIAQRVGVDQMSLDYVYFSAASGAEPHTDLLNPEHFTDWTFVIPVILPRGESIITAEDASCIAELGQMYEFNHERVHSMTVEDSESGCVVIMVAIKTNDKHA